MSPLIYLTVLLLRPHQFFLIPYGWTLSGHLCSSTWCEESKRNVFAKKPKQRVLLLRRRKRLLIHVMMIILLLFVSAKTFIRKKFPRERRHQFVVRTDKKPFFLSRCRRTDRQKDKEKMRIAIWKFAIKGKIIQRHLAHRILINKLSVSTFNC